MRGSRAEGPGYLLKPLGARRSFGVYNTTARMRGTFLHESPPKAHLPRFAAPGYKKPTSWVYKPLKKLLRLLEAEGPGATLYFNGGHNEDNPMWLVLSSSGSRI